MRRKKTCKNKKETRTFEEIEKQELAEQETKQLNTQKKSKTRISFFFSRCLEKISTKKTSTCGGHNECFRNFKGKGAEQLVTNSQTQLDKVFDEFLAGVSPDVKRKVIKRFILLHCQRLAIIGFRQFHFQMLFYWVPVRINYDVTAA